MGKKGQYVFTDGGDEEAIAARRVRHLPRRRTCATRRSRRSTCTTEKNTRTNLPAQIEIYADRRRRLQVPVHGQGRRLGQQELPVPGDQGAAESRAACSTFVDEKMRTLGTAACPPYHLALVIGGTSAPSTASRWPSSRRRATSTRCPTEGNEHRPRLPRLGARAADPRAGAEHRASARSSAASTSATTCASSACRATAPRCPVGIARVVLGRSASARQDHPRRHLPRAAGERSRHSTCPTIDARGPRRRGRQRSISTGR